MEEGRDSWWHEEMAAADIENFCPPEELDAEDPLFILYTSGSTGKPKGVLHTTAGYLLYTHLTFKWIFDYHEEDLHFCTADIGWITGHSYVVYGPLSATAPPASCSRACRPIRSPTASGISATSTR